MSAISIVVAESRGLLSAILTAFPLDRDDSKFFHSPRVGGREGALVYCLQLNNIT